MLRLGVAPWWVMGCLALVISSCLALLHGGTPSSAPSVSPITNVTVVNTSKPLAPTFEIRRFEIQGSTALPQDYLDLIMRDATGTNVGLPQIRHGLVRLQEAFRDRGYQNVLITLPRQSLTDGVVKVRVAEGANNARPQTLSVTAPQIEAWQVPTYEVRHFEVRGNTAFTPEQIDLIIGPLAGPTVTEDRIQKALAKLQGAYRERGYTRAAVTVRQQVLTDGVMAIQVDEGTALEAETAMLASKAAPVAAVPPPPPRTFEVRHYEVLGNTLLKPDALAQVFTNATGTSVTLQQIQKALGELQLAYRERGFATTSVGLPQQQLTNAIIRVQVTEGVLVDIRMTGNRYFSSNNIASALPSLSTNTPLNGRILQQELDIANQNRDRQIYPILGPGPEPGTSALTLRVEDRLPLHARVEVNNYNTPNTPDWRVNTSAQYNNLWQLEHQIGISYGFTPEAFKSPGLMSDYFFNRPLISYFGAYYRMPFGTADSVSQQIESSVGRFGYDEATHQFRLPPVGGRPDLTFFVSGSSSDTGVQYGSPILVSQTPLLTIVSQDSGQDLTINQGAGARFNLPRVLDDRHRLNFSGGLDAKYYSLESYNTNNFIITTVVTNSQGSQVITTVVSSPQPVAKNAVSYLPLSLGMDYSQSDSGGSFSASLGLNGNFLGSSSAFSSLAVSPDVQPAYGKASLSITRDQKVFKDWSLLIRANGQAATGPLINNEQFALGGINSVRGYYEGDVYGDMGWFGSVELRTPYIATEVPIWSGSVPTWLRAVAYVDGGQAFLLDTPPGVGSRASLLGVGFGVSANINNHVDTRIAVGWPLRDSPNTTAGSPRVYFSLGGQF